MDLGTIAGFILFSILLIYIIGLTFKSIIKAAVKDAVIELLPTIVSSLKENDINKN